MKEETALHVVVDTEELASLLNGDNIHETCRVGGISADFAVHPDQALVDDLRDFGPGQRIFQFVTQDQHHRQGLAEFVRSSRWPGSLEISWRKCQTTKG